MKRLAAFPLVLPLVLFIFTGCDKSSSNLMGPRDYTPGLSSDYQQSLSAQQGSSSEGIMVAGVLIPPPGSVEGNVFKIEFPEGVARDYIQALDAAAIALLWDGLSIGFTPGKPDVVIFNKRVAWDGVSPLESGVQYHFNSTEDFQEAYGK